MKKIFNGAAGQFLHAGIVSERRGRLAKFGVAHSGRRQSC